MNFGVCPYCLADDKWVVLNEYRHPISAHEWTEETEVRCMNKYTEDGVETQCGYVKTVYADNGIEYDDDI